MATGNPLLGTLRRSIGDVTFYRRNGVQVSRARIRQIANPRTDPQTITRLAFSTASKMGQHLRGILSHSFQGKKYGQPSINYFVSQLSKQLRSYILDSLSGSTSTSPFKCAPILPPTASGIGCGAEALISSGDLQGMPFALSDDNNGGLLVGVAGAVTVSTGLTVTVAEYADVFGVPASDQVTIVEGWPEDLEYISESEIFKGVRFDYLRWNILADVDPTAKLFVSGSQSGEVKLNPAILDMERTDPRVLNLIFAIVDNEQLGVVTGSSTSDAGNVFGSGLAKDVCLAGVIVSRYETGVWRRSTCRLVRTPLYTPATALEIQDYWGFNDIESCMALAQPSTAAPSEEEYLNKKKAEGVA